MRKPRSLTLVGWHVRIKHCDEEYPWDLKINRIVKMESDLERYEAEFECGLKIYIIPDEISWFQFREPIKDAPLATVLRLQRNHVKLRLVK